MSTPIRQERRVSCTLCGHSLFVKDWPNLRAVRCPMLLTCGHTACRQCLISYANLNQQVTCRQCNTVVVLSSRTDVDQNFPVNYYVLGKLLYKEALQRHRLGVQYIPTGMPLASLNSRPALAVRPLSHTQQNTVCFECSVHEAVCRCEQCDSVYCHGCFAKVHSSGKALRSHTRIPISDEPANPFMLGPCVTHPEVNYRFYCEEDTVLVCPLCAVLNHNGHTLVEMSVKNKSLLPQVQEATLTLMKVSKELERSRKGLRQLSPGAESEQLLQMRHQVSMHFTSLHGFLQMHEERLVLQLDVGKVSCYDDVDNMTQEVGDQLKNVQKLLKMAQTTMEPDLLSKVDLTKLMSELRDAVSLPCKLTLPESKALDVEFKVLTDVLPILENHCTLNITAPPPPMLMSLLPDDIEETPSENSEDSEITATLANTNPFIAALERKQSTPPRVSISNNTKTSPHSSQSIPSPQSSSSSDSSSQRVVVTIRQNKPKPVDWSVGTSELIRLSHVFNPSNFYVQRLADDPKLEQLLLDLELVAPTCQPFKIPKIGNLCIVQYSLDGKWYRGRIKSISAGKGTESMCDVFYIDYGNTEQVPIHRVFELPTNLCEFQPLCRHCILNGIVPRHGEWSNNAIKVFVEVTTKPKLQVKVVGFTGNSLNVDLVILSNDTLGAYYEPTSVSDILCYLDHGSIMGQPSTALSGVMKPSRKFSSGHFNLVAGSSLQVVVTHIDSPMCFYVQRVEKHAEGLGNMMKALNEHYQNPDKKYNIYYPQMGMCCVAKYAEDGNWYRAMVTDLPDKKMVSVQYVDYGNSEVVSWENVKKLHEKFFLIDAQAVKCQLYDLKLPGDTKIWEEAACVQFHTLCYNKTLRMVVNARNNTDLTVSLYQRVGAEEHSVAVTMAQAGFGICSRKRKSSQSNDFSAQATVQKRANTGAHPQYMGPQPPRNKVGRGNYTPYLEVQPCLRADPTVPVEACLAPSMLQLRRQPPSLPREPELRKEVQVVSHNSPGEIYIRISSLVPQLERVIEAMQTYYKNPPVEVEEKEWRRDEYCAVQRDIAPQWCRAVVSEKLSENLVKVFLVDHAMEMEVRTADLYVLPEEFSSLLNGAIRCHMTGIKAAGDSGKWPILARERLGDLLVKYDAVYMTKTGPIVDNSIPVELWVEDVVVSGALEPIVKKWSCLNQMLVEHGVAIPVRSEETHAVVPDSDQMMEELIKYTQDRYNVPCTDDVSSPPQSSLTFTPAAKPKRRNLPEEPMVVDITEDSQETPTIFTQEAPTVFSEEKPKFLAQWVEPEPPKRLKFNALATYVDYSGYFYLQELPKSEKALAKLQRMVDQHYRDSVPAPEDMLWSVGQICVGKYHVDQKWYRAKVIEILDDDDIRVQFVDFGNTETLSVVDLRKAAFVTSVPIQCFKCKFHGLIPTAKDNEWTTFDLDIIHGSIVDRECNVVLAELPSPGQIAKVCSLVTDLKRDMFKFLIEQEIATRGIVASSPTLSEVSDSESVFSEHEEEPMQVSEPVQTDTRHSVANSPEDCAETEGMQVGEDKTENKETDVNMEAQLETVQNPEQEEAICVILSVESTGPEEEEAEKPEDDVVAIDTVQSSEKHVVCISSDEDNSNDSAGSFKYKLDPRGKFALLSFEVNSLLLVDITIVVNAVEFFIKPESLENSVPLNMLTEEIAREAAKLPPLKSIEIGQACCAQYMGQFFRALVVNINKDSLTANVNFVDYGNREELPISDLREIRDSWMQLPRQALHCKVMDVEILPEVDDNLLDSEISAALLSGPVYAKMWSKEEPCKIQLLKQDQSTSVYEEMIEKKLVKMIES